MQRIPNTDAGARISPRGRIGIALAPSMSVRTSSIGFAVAAILALGDVAGAQSNQNPGSATANIFSTDPAISCSSAPTPPIPPNTTPIAANCERSQAGIDGFSTTANAVSTAGRGGSTSATSTFSGTQPQPFIVTDANASYTQYVTITGNPITDIYRIMLRSAVAEVITSNVPNITSAAAVSMEVGVVHDPGAPIPDPSAGAVVNDPSVTFIERFIDGASLGSSNTIFFQLFAQATLGLIDTDQSGTSIVSAIIFDPTITILDSDLNDITARYTLVYDPDAPPLSAVPEPASLTLIATGFAGVAGAMRRRRKARAAAA